MRGKLTGKVALTKEQYLKNLLTATMVEVDRIHRQLCKPVSGRYENTKADLQELYRQLGEAKQQVIRCDHDPELLLEISTGDFT